MTASKTPLKLLLLLLFSSDKARQSLMIRIQSESGGEEKRGSRKVASLCKCRKVAQVTQWEHNVVLPRPCTLLACISWERVKKCKQSLLLLRTLIIIFRLQEPGFSEQKIKILLDLCTEEEDGEYDGTSKTKTVIVPSSSFRQTPCTVLNEEEEEIFVKLYVRNNILSSGSIGGEGQWIVVSSRPKNGTHQKEKGGRCTFLLL